MCSSSGHILFVRSVSVSANNNIQKKHFNFLANTQSLVMITGWLIIFTTQIQFRRRIGPRRRLWREPISSAFRFPIYLRR